MPKLSVAIFIDEAYSAEEGGGYVYSLQMLNAIQSHSSEEVQFSLIQTKAGGAWKSRSIVVGRGVRSLRYAWLKVLMRLRPSKRVARSLRRLRNKHIESVLRTEKIDLVYYLTPEIQVMDFPYVTTHWDLSYLNSYPFPEMQAQSTSRYREVLDRAMFVFCESEAGRRELMQFSLYAYRKSAVLPLFTTAGDEYVAGSLSPGIEAGKYFYYPAQFWAHKNHYIILTALKILKSRGLSPQLVLTGSDKGNLSYVKSLIEEMGLREQVHFAGFVTRAEVLCLYSNAIALVMPTYLGPTNLPLLEAASLGCPVICSDFEGHREYLGEGATYLDPSRAEDWAETMEQYITGTTKAPQKRTFTSNEAMTVLTSMLHGLHNVRRTWSV